MNKKILLYVVILTMVSTTIKADSTNIKQLITACMPGDISAPVSLSTSQTPPPLPSKPLINTAEPKEFDPSESAARSTLSTFSDSTDTPTGDSDSSSIDTITLFKAGEFEDKEVELATIIAALTDKKNTLTKKDQKEADRLQEDINRFMQKLTDTLTNRVASKLGIEIENRVIEQIAQELSEGIANAGPKPTLEAEIILGTTLEIILQTIKDKIKQYEMEKSSIENH